MLTEGGGGKNPQLPGNQINLLKDYTQAKVFIKEGYN